MYNDAAADDYNSIPASAVPEDTGAEAPVSLFGDDSSTGGVFDGASDPLATSAAPAAVAAEDEEDRFEVTPVAPAAAPAASHQHRPAPHPPRKSSMTDVEVKSHADQGSPASQFEITVQDPVKKGDGMNAYTAYTIVTKTSLPQYKSPKLTVTRRYNHFSWLYKELTDKYAGIIIPPIPEKQTIGRFKDELIGERRAALEKCLRRIVAHPTLFDAPEVILFLSEEDLESEV